MSQKLDMLLELNISLTKKMHNLAQGTSMTEDMVELNNVVAPQGCELQLGGNTLPDTYPAATTKDCSTSAATNDPFTPAVDTIDKVTPPELRPGLPGAWLTMSSYSKTFSECIAQGNSCLRFKNSTTMRLQWLDK